MHVTHIPICEESTEALCGEECTERDPNEKTASCAKCGLLAMAATPSPGENDEPGAET